MIECAQCGHQNAKHYSFCLLCGAELKVIVQDVAVNKKSSHRSRGLVNDAFESSKKKILVKARSKSKV